MLCFHCCYHNYRTVSTLVCGYQKVETSLCRPDISSSTIVAGALKSCHGYQFTRMRTNILPFDACANFVTKATLNCRLLYFDFDFVKARQPENKELRYYLWCTRFDKHISTLYPLVFTGTMPSTSIEIGSNRLFWVKDDNSNHQEPVSNFSIEVLGSVNVSHDAGGSGLLMKLKRYPDNAEK